MQAKTTFLCPGLLLLCKMQDPSAECLEVVTADNTILEVPLMAPYLREVDVSRGRVVVDQLDDLREER